MKEMIVKILTVLWNHLGWRMSCPKGKTKNKKRIPKKAKTFFENPSYVIRFTQPFIHSWIASSGKKRLDLLFAKL